MASVRRVCWKLPHTQRTSSYWETMMRFYQGQHRFYCGIDLHARTMHLCLLDEAGTVVFDENLANRPEAFRRAIEPYRENLVAGVGFSEPSVQKSAAADLRSSTASTRLLTG